MNAPQAPFVGQSVTRREDARFLTGRGQYTDDMFFHQSRSAEYLRVLKAKPLLGMPPGPGGKDMKWMELVYTRAK